MMIKHLKADVRETIGLIPISISIILDSEELLSNHDSDIINLSLNFRKTDYITSNPNYINRINNLIKRLNYNYGYNFCDFDFDNNNCLFDKLIIN